MKLLLPILLALASANLLFAQTVKPRILCGNEIFSHFVKEKYPALDAAFAQTFDAAKLTRPAADRSPLNIKVVVHVVWNAPEENLADSVIENQILVLNEDYNRLNADTANLRAVFQPVAGNADIHFQLEAVVRTQTTQTFAIDLFGNSILSELKHSDQGGSDAWDPDKYLNIWVCNIQPTTIFGIPVGQILGFAFPPNGLNNWPADSGAPSAEEDGVVIDFRMFGRNNPNPLPDPTGGSGNLLVRGRTPVHEVGHYLGLRHIWGDGGLLGPNNCAESDGVDDTPYANAQSDFDCNKNRNTCPQVEAFYNDDVPDLVENYMDYSSEDCMNMFTKGQVELMRNVLMGPRNGLVESSGILNPVASAPDWSISPNPAQDRFTVTLGDTPRDFSLRVMNATGQMVYTQAAHSSSCNVATAQWAPGLYVVELRSEGQVSAKRLLKQ